MVDLAVGLHDTAVAARRRSTVNDWLLLVMTAAAAAASHKSKVKYADIAVRSLTCHTATGTHVPYGIRQCYLPLDRADVPVVTAAEAGTRLSDHRRMQG